MFSNRPFWFISIDVPVSLETEAVNNKTTKNGKGLTKEI